MKLKDMSKELSEPKKRGGAREGAGRKPKADKKQTITIRLPPDIIERLPKRKAADEIERALRMMWGINEY